jgi:hypothetical protein
MRPQQQGRRQRNRNSSGGGGNRRNQNPLQRSYESNGPDVKIRGNAQVIADKYATLARDAQSSGDTVMAENYLQHAEHYNRIILAAQAQMQTQRDERQQAEGADDNGGDDNPSDDRQNDNRQTENRASSGNGEDRGRGQRQRRNGADRGDDTPSHDASEAPQPVIDDTPVEVRLEEQEQTSGKSRRSSPRRPRKPRENADGGETGTEAAADDGKPEAAAAEV